MAEVLVQIPFVLMVTRPLKVFVPVADEIIRFVAVPPPTVVVPVTEKLKPPRASVVPLPSDTLPPTVVVEAVVVEADPPMVKFPPTLRLVPGNVLVPLPLNVR